LRDKSAEKRNTFRSFALMEKASVCKEERANASRMRERPRGIPREARLRTAGESGGRERQRCRYVKTDYE